MDRSKNITLAIVATIFMFATMAFGADNNAASTLQEELNDSVVPGKTIDEDEFLCYPPLMPEYPGGNDALLKLISDNIRLPKCVKSGEVSGTSVISFMVQPSGKCDRFKVVRSLNKECDAEAIRVTVKGLGQIGYVANSSYTVRGESWSAGRIYDRMGKKAVGTVKIVLPDGVLCKLEK